jgi:hypothetical protein
MLNAKGNLIGPFAHCCNSRQGVIKVTSFSEEKQCIQISFVCPSELLRFWILSIVCNHWSSD